METKNDAYWEQVDHFLSHYNKVIFVTGLLVFLFFSFLLFNPNVSTGGDDSGYIIAAKDFLAGNSFPTWHGSFYPIFLSFFVWLFGVNVIIFKILSLLLMAGHFVFFFLAFKKESPAWAFLLSIGVTVLSSHLIYYASQTYSEALFLFLQALSFYYFYHFCLKQEEKGPTVPLTVHYLVFAFLLFLLSITRNIGIVAIVAFVAFLLVQRKVRATAVLSIAFLFFHFLLKIYKELAWKIEGSGIKGQLENIAWKNFYLHDQGKEDVWGFLMRFWDNSNLYLSKHLGMMLGIRPMGTTTVNPALTIAFYLAFILATVMIWKKSKNLLLIGFYLAIMISGTFISQQKHWDQERLILIYLPLITLYIASGVYFWFSSMKNKKAQLVPVALSLMMLFSIGVKTVSKIDKETIKATLEGDKYATYTPDWKNYLTMCEWVGKNLPESAIILCRKPELAKIYGKVNFEGQYRVFSTNADTIKSVYKEKKITHVIMGSLRLHPQKKTDRTITTIRNSLLYYTSKYPADFKLVKVIGDSEPAYLFECNYDTPITLENIRQSVDAAIIINPRNYKLTAFKADQLLQNKHYKEALYFYNLAIQFSPDKVAQNFYHRGICLKALSMFKEAIADFRVVTELDENFQDARLNISDCEYQLKRLEKEKG